MLERAKKLTSRFKRPVRTNKPQNAVCIHIRNLRGLEPRKIYST